MAAARQAERHTDTEPEFSLQIAELLPEQGAWSEADYLWLTNHTNRLIELSNGRIELLPMPTEKHHSMLKYLCLAFYSFVERRDCTSAGRHEICRAWRVHPWRAGNFRAAAGVRGEC